MIKDQAQSWCFSKASKHEPISTTDEHFGFWFVCLFVLFFCLCWYWSVHYIETYSWAPRQWYVILLFSFVLPRAVASCVCGRACRFQCLNESHPLHSPTPVTPLMFHTSMWVLPTEIQRKAMPFSCCTCSETSYEYLSQSSDEGQHETRKSGSSHVG